jgi:hypothetical protein
MANVCGRIDKSREPRSNVTSERREQRLKQSCPISSTDAGMQIEVSEEQPENACASKLVTCDGRPNVTKSRAMHWKKQRHSIDCTDAGMQIEASNEQDENACRAKQVAQLATSDLAQIEPG